MTDLTKTDFVALVKADNVQFNIVTRYPVVHCSHDSGVPVYFAIIEYPDEGVGEMYRYHPGQEKWLLQQYGWLDAAD